MKTIAALIATRLGKPEDHRNLLVLFKFSVILGLLILVYSILFHFFMLLEGERHSFITGIYWTLTVMSTLGFGDITFTGDIGRAFSVVVLLSGVVFLLALLPFTFIKFFYEPLMAAQKEARVPRALPGDLSGHAIIVGYDPIAKALVSKLNQYRICYAVLLGDFEEALRLHDQGVKVVVGDFDDPDTYARLRVTNAAIVVSALSDVINTNVAFTVREINKQVPIITTATTEASVDILELAGSTHVVQMGAMLGYFLSRRIVGGDAKTHVIGNFSELMIAEAGVAYTPLVGKTVGEAKLREELGVNVVGVWERGQFQSAGPETSLTKTSILILAGSKQQLNAYDQRFVHYSPAVAPVVIIGGGRVGRAVGAALKAQDRDYRIVERLKDRVRDKEHYVYGDAAELEVLEKAGIMDAPSVLVTTHDDDINIYLTLYCRRLRPDVQVISRATFERNIMSLHRAGADFVMSYASMGANTVFNLLRRNDILLVAEGLDVFRVAVPKNLVNKSIMETSIRKETGCTVIAVSEPGRPMVINPDPSIKLPESGELILIGSADAEDRFLKLFK